MIITTAQLPRVLLPTSAIQSLDSWVLALRELINGTQQKKQWTALIHLTWWMIWKERNARIFGNEASSLRCVHDKVVQEAKLWREAGRSSAADLLLRPRESD